MLPMTVTEQQLLAVRRRGSSFMGDPPFLRLRIVELVIYDPDDDGVVYDLASCRPSTSRQLITSAAVPGILADGAALNQRPP